MFLFKHVNAAPANTDPNIEMLTFNPRQIVRGIKYHVLETGLVAEVDLESCECVVSYLSERGKCSRIQKQHWAEMKNSQRLEWLLKQGRASVAIRADKVAELRFH